MLRYEPRYWWIAASLALAAGFVDALAFLNLGGYFVSFMSGNSTRAGVGLASNLSHAAIAFSLIAAFVSGVAAGSLVSRGLAATANARALSLVAGLLAGAGVCVALNLHVLTVGLMAMAMGASNTTFQREGEVSVGVTYMTGTLVKLGQRLADALSGGPRFAWAPYLLLWSGLVGGAALGAFVYPVLGLNAVWIAAAAVALIALDVGRGAPATQKPG